jgi:hypothetical protein
MRPNEGAHRGEGVSEVTDLGLSRDYFLST